MQHYLISFKIRKYSIPRLLSDVKFSEVTYCPHGSAHSNPQHQRSTLFPSFGLYVKGGTEI